MSGSAHPHVRKCRNLHTVATPQTLHIGEQIVELIEKARIKVFKERFFLEPEYVDKSLRKMDQWNQGWVVEYSYYDDSHPW